MRYAIIGLGRTGSHLSAMLAAAGARHLSLIDPDFIEEHNLGEMTGITESDLGSPKVAALARSLPNRFLGQAGENQSGHFLREPL